MKPDSFKKAAPPIFRWWLFALIFLSQVSAYAAAPTFTSGYPKVDAADTKHSSLELKVQTNEIGKAYYVVLADGAAAPSDAQIKAGQDDQGTAVDADKKGVLTLTADTEANSYIIRLTAATDYDIYVVAEDSAETLNAQVVVNVTTAAAPSDTTPPVFDSLGNSKTVGATTIDFEVKINEDGTAYYVVLDDNATAPTEAQVKNGQDNANEDVAENKKGNLDLTANTGAVASISGLTSSTSYDLYIIAEDAEGNVATAETFSFTTLAPLTNISGNYNNTGKTLTNITIEAGATITGGTLAGTITGDATNPPTLDGVTIASGATLSYVILSSTVVLPSPLTTITFGLGIQFQSLSILPAGFDLTSILPILTFPISGVTLPAIIDLNISIIVNGPTLLSEITPASTVSVFGSGAEINLVSGRLKIKLSDGGMCGFRPSSANSGGGNRRSLRISTGNEYGFGNALYLTTNGVEIKSQPSVQNLESLTSYLTDEGFTNLTVKDDGNISVEKDGKTIIFRPSITSLEDQNGTLGFQNNKSFKDGGLVTFIFEDDESGKKREQVLYPAPVSLDNMTETSVTMLTQNNQMNDSYPEDGKLKFEFDGTTYEGTLDYYVETGTSTAFAVTDNSDHFLITYTDGTKQKLFKVADNSSSPPVQQQPTTPTDPDPVDPTEPTEPTEPLKPIEGKIDNTGTTLTDITLLKDTVIEGGILEGKIVGPENGFVKLDNLKISANSEVSNVTIGKDVTFGAGVSLKNVIFAEGVTIPLDIKLGTGVKFTAANDIPIGLDITATLPGFTAPVAEVQQPAAIDLSADPVVNGKGLLQKINEQPEFAGNDLQMDQSNKTGNLQLEIEGLIFEVAPIKVKRASKTGDGTESVRLGFGNTVIFTTKDGLEIEAYPVVQSITTLKALLAALNITKFTITEDGNLKVPTLDDRLWISGRAALSSEPAEAQEQTGFKFKGDLVVLVFENSNGEKRQQVLYPAPASNGIIQQSGGASLSEEGILSFKFGEKAYTGRLDYGIETGEATESYEVTDIEDINGDGVKDFLITYPQGDKQKLFALPPAVATE
ncbi:hypothetical protein [Candidatus Marithrix sp. Canyon 246]|uniref:hypothetical protein n=2 Tax=Candidatus Marithrix sp. Canyon 246 TaxID=1827136 RepID=UPI000849FD9F|nr:hypothetical protein [Candidatus Marithrix sp. Canyon 246]